MEFYSPKEERINIFSHAFGFLMSGVGFTLLEIHALKNGDTKHVIGFGIFGVSLMTLYLASTFYHSAKNLEKRKKLRILDHASIYVLIAGTYTPFTLIIMDSTIGMVFFGASWSIALIGIVLKIYFTGKYKLLSTIMYILMGSIIFFDVNALTNNLSTNGLDWLLIGAVSYVMGAIVYSISRIKYNHAIFHFFVLLGSFSHFMAVYFYILPVK